MSPSQPPYLDALARPLSQGRTGERRTARRALLAGAALAGAACAREASARPSGAVSFPERTPAYLPLLVAIVEGLYGSPPVRLAPLQRPDGRRVAAAVVDGAAAAGALSAADFVEAVAAGAPLVAIGALTRRFSGQLVAASGDGAERRGVDDLLGGGWRAVRFGLQAGSDGTERMARFLLLSRGGAAPAARMGLLAGDPLAGEPRWLRYSTSEGLVAALKDGRLAAFLGRSPAAAQATILGGTRLVANFSDGGVAPDVAGALGVVLVARRDRAQRPDASSDRLLAALVRGCALAAGALAGPDGPAVAARALPDRDPLHLATALRLDAPSPETAAYALDGRAPAGGLARLLELLALAGRPLALEPEALETDRFAISPRRP